MFLVIDPFNRRSWNKICWIFQPCLMTRGYIQSHPKHGQKAYQFWKKNMRNPPLARRRRVTDDCILQLGVGMLDVRRQPDESRWLFFPRFSMAYDGIWNAHAPICFSFLMYIGAYIIAMYVKSVQSITDINYRQFFFRTCAFGKWGSTRCLTAHVCPQTFN